MDPALEVITPPEGCTEFVANGKTYRKSASLSARRYQWMENIRQEMQYGRDPVEVFQTNKQVFELLNKQQFAHAAVLVHGNMTGAAFIADRATHPAVKLFCLFWNYDGEDRKIMTDDLMAEKCADMDGVDVGFLFQQAVSNAPGLLAAYRLALEHSSNGESSKDQNVSTPVSND